MNKTEEQTQAIFTIGHSTRSFEQFAELLKDSDIELLIDVRTIPKSRHNPQYNQDTLDAMLQAKGVAYRHMKGLGGLRHAKKDSINKGWINASFRGFADYMQTGEFSENILALIETARESRTAIMCAEAMPWKCHRSLIADALVVRDRVVFHIMGKGSKKEHTLNPMARVEGIVITYPERS
jgi:uncharacterized protein (DUF488 family)